MSVILDADEGFSSGLLDEDIYCLWSFPASMNADEVFELLYSHYIHNNQRFVSITNIGLIWKLDEALL